MNSPRKPAGQSEQIKYSKAYWKRWALWREKFRKHVLYNDALPAEAKVIGFLVDDRVNHKTGEAYVGLRGIDNDVGVHKDAASAMLNILFQAREIDLLQPETEGGAKLGGIAWPLVDGKRWPRPCQQDVSCLGKKPDLSGNRGRPVCTAQTQEHFLKHLKKELPNAPAPPLANGERPAITETSSNVVKGFADLLANIRRTNVVSTKVTLMSSAAIVKRTSDGEDDAPPSTTSES